MAKKKETPPLKHGNKKQVNAADPNSILLALPLYRSHGLYLHDKELYNKALKSYNVALLVDSEDGASLRGRADSCMKLSMYEEALKDAEKLLAIDSEDLHAFYRKAQTKYLLAEFEESLMYNHRGRKKRKVPVIFDEGVMACEETIEDCIGRKVGSILLGQMDWINAMEKDKILQKEHEKKRMFSKIPLESKSSFRYSESQEKWQIVRMKRFSWQKYMGAHFAEDYFFCKYLKSHPEVPSAHKKNSAKIIEIVEKCCENLKKTKMMLRERKPYYVYSYTDPNLREALKKRKQTALKNKMAAAKMAIEKVMEKLEKIYKRNLKDSMQAARRAKAILDETPPKLLPSKNLYLEYLYDHVSICHFEVLKIISDRDEERQVRLFYGLPVLGKEDIDDIAKAAYQPYPDNMAIIRENSKRLRVADSEMEMAWLHYDMGLAHFCANYKLELARTHAKKCYAIGKKHGNLIWELLGYMLTSKIEFKLGNLLEARNDVQSALEMSRLLDDPEVTNFIGACINFIEYSRGEENDLIVQREEKILRLLADKEMKKEAEDIFRHIARQPMKRRMSIVPGVKNRLRRRISYASTKGSKSSKISFGRTSLKSGDEKN